MVHIDDNGIGTLVGTFSWGGGCEYDGNVVFAEVKSVLSWIQERIEYSRYLY